jgi:hypothetical protein
MNLDFRIFQDVHRGCRVPDMHLTRVVLRDAVLWVRLVRRIRYGREIDARVETKQPSIRTTRIKSVEGRLRDATYKVCASVASHS